jgi:hypothetical protein
VKISLLVLLLFLLESVAAVAQTTGQVQIDVTAPVLVFDVSDPSKCRYCANEPPVVNDGNRLKTLSGVGPSGEFAPHLNEGEPAEQSLAGVISGGLLKLQYDPSTNKVVAVVAYSASRSPDAQELSTLAEFTRRQLGDGAVKKFVQRHAMLTGLFVEFEVPESKSLTVATRL